MAIPGPDGQHIIGARVLVLSRESSAEAGREAVCNLRCAAKSNAQKHFSSKGCTTDAVVCI